jgi:hypothetical protein
MTVFMIAAMLCAVSGCWNPFAPKLDLQPPSQSCNDLTQIQDVLCTFRNAYLFKDTTLYSSIVGQEFVFTYRDYDRGIDVSWGRTEEMRTTYALFQSAQSLLLIWNNDIVNNGNDTARTIVRGFTLTVTFNPSDISRVEGYANLTLARSSIRDNWKIIRWRDESNF